MVEPQLFLGFIDIALLALTALSTGLGIVQSQKAEEKQEEAQESQRKIAEERNRRARLRTVREARIKSAAIQAAQGGQAGQSSAALGGVGSIQSQAASSIGSQSFITGQTNIATNALQDARDAQNLGVLSQQVASIGFGLSKSTGAFDRFFNSGPSAEAVLPTRKPLTPTQTQDINKSLRGTLFGVDF